jgi:Fur family transcriptional regulator, ferric uptake regulator
MVENPDQIISKLKQAGHRITPIRAQIVEIFINSSTPISAIDLLEAFRILKINVNKTTIYRELGFLLRESLIKEIEFREGKTRYELDTGHHHHHVICQNCKKVEDVDLKVDLHEEERLIEKKTGFKVTSHALEFFGFCKECKKSL